MNDAAHCRRIVRSHARTFWLASHFLGAAKRRSAFALYAFCRVADDLVDLDRWTPLDEMARRLDDYRRKLDDALSGQPSGPLFRELHRAARLHDVPASAFHELLDGIARDCTPTRYATWSDLERYCQGVASSVGEMCTYVFGVPGDAATHARALRHARTLGVAMQLTNILRDIGEDARNGRCYLPDDELERFGLNRETVLAGVDARFVNWRALMSFQIERTRRLYALAMPGIALLSPDAQRCAHACASGYEGILTAIEENAYDSIKVRARMRTGARAALLWKVWRTPLAMADGDGTSPSTEPHPEGELVSWASATPR